MVSDSLVIDAQEKKVVMYSARWCSICKTARTYFQNNGIAFQEIDIDESEQDRKLFLELGGRGVPMILVGGKRMNGFNQERFDAMYGS